MQFESVFSNFLAVDDLNLDNNVIESYCRENIKRYPSPHGNNQSYIINQEHSYNNIRSEIQPLINIVNTKINELHRFLQFSETHYQKICDAWINLNQCENTSQPHYHVGKFFSVVYYVKANANSGKLYFTNPDVGKQFAIDHHNVVGTYNQYNTCVKWVIPKTGRLVIFPAWLSHHVEPMNTDEDRISIGFNSVIIENPLPLVGLFPNV
jgi:uncharacterized protein (TIGR02466 family)